MLVDFVGQKIPVFVGVEAPATERSGRKKDQLRFLFGLRAKLFCC